MNDNQKNVQNMSDSESAPLLNHSEISEPQLINVAPSTSDIVSDDDLLKKNEYPKKSVE